MYFSTPFFSLLAVVVAGVKAFPTAAASYKSELTDWKYAYGWDGSVISVGTPYNTSSSIEKRTPGGVFICDQLNFSGRCGFAVQALSECIQLGSDWIFQISSFGPDPGATCFPTRLSADFAVHRPTDLPRSESGCSSAGSVWSFQYPGDATGGWGTSNPWDDKIASFMCVPTGSGDTFTGDATFYTPDGNFGACGAPLQNSDFIVALSEAHYDNGAHCWQHLDVEYNGQHIDVTVGDLCPGCGTDDIDLSEGAFQSIENLDVGRIQVSWSFK